MVGHVAADAGDEVLDALDELVAAIRTNTEVNRKILRRAQAIRRRRQRGDSYGDIANSEERPLIVEMLRHNQERLALSGHRFRRAEAGALRQEGLTMDEIAERFGVTRPRIIALLRDDAPSA